MSGEWSNTSSMNCTPSTSQPPSPRSGSSPQEIQSMLRQFGMPEIKRKGSLTPNEQQQVGQAINNLLKRL